jgi:tetratricopeptide (TPR) repeat protein
MKNQILSDLFDSALTIHKRGDLAQARQLYVQLLKIDDSYFDALHMLGVLIYQMGDKFESLKYLEKALKIDSLNAEANYNFARVLQDCQDDTRAIHYYKTAVDIDFKYSSGYTNIGSIMHNFQRWDEAIYYYKLALEFDPNNAAVLNNMGFAFHKSNNREAAIESYSKAIAINPNLAVVYYNLANVYLEAHDYLSSLALYQRCVRLDDSEYKYFNNLGIALKELNFIVEAQIAFQNSLKIEKRNPKAYINLGNIARMEGDLKLAIKYFDMAIAADPQAVDAKFDKSTALLTLGAYDDGWPLYEFRWFISEGGPIIRKFPGITWNGRDSIKDKRILIYAEQGLGDTIQFSRFIKYVRRYSDTVFFEVQKPLKSLLEIVFNDVNFLISPEANLQKFDYHCSLLSLPLVFNIDLESIPETSGYIEAHADLIEKWAKRIESNRAFKVGLVWEGGAGAKAINDSRNINIEMIARVFADVDVDFFSLQKGEPAESEIRLLASTLWPNNNFFNYSSDLVDFSETAGLIAQLDLVIGVDTSTVHLAAAMGKPTWILNRFNTCWRWLQNRADSPWYDAVKLYRQGPNEDWLAVLSRMRPDLISFSNEKKSY